MDDVLAKNPSKDIRQLLGSDSLKLMNETFDNDMCSKDIAFNAVNAFILEENIRSQISTTLHTCLRSSGAA